MLCCGASSASCSCLREMQLLLAPAKAGGRAPAPAEVLMANLDISQLLEAISVLWRDLRAEVLQTPRSTDAAAAHHRHHHQFLQATRSIRCHRGAPTSGLAPARLQLR
jgi:hypothetical protein